MENHRKQIGVLLRLLEVDAADSRSLVNWYVKGLSNLLAQKRVVVDALVLMVAEDVLTHYVLVREAHKKLREAEVDGKAWGANLDFVFKAREKWRKALADLMTFFKDATPSSELGVSEVFEVLDAEIDGIMESNPAGMPLTDVRPDVQAVGQETQLDMLSQLEGQDD